MLLYEAMKPTLDFDGGEEWQNKRNENSDLITVRKILPHKQA